MNWAVCSSTDLFRALLADRSKRSGFPTTSLHPGHNINPEVFNTIARGEEFTIPNMGLETVHLVSPKAITLRAYAEAMANWFGRHPRLRYEPFEEWAKSVSDERGKEL